MNTKLTLKLNKDVIELAKAYAKKRHTSLSVLVENYFRNLSGERENTEPILTPLVQELSGIIDLPEDFDIEGTYTDYLVEKYS